MASVHRFAPGRPCPANTGLVLPVGQYSRLSSGSYVPGIHVMPPPCSEAFSLGHVLSAGSPLRGVDHHVHCSSPVTGSNDLRNPGMSIASPPTPTITWFFTISGADVEKYCLRASA